MTEMTPASGPSRNDAGISASRTSQMTPAGAELQPPARSVIGAAIIREYDLADPDDEGFRPEAFTLAGAVLNALSEAGYEVVQEVEPDEVCLREVEVTYGTFTTGPTPESHVLCLRPKPCDNPHHKTERPTYGTG